MSQEESSFLPTVKPFILAKRLPLDKCKATLAKEGLKRPRNGRERSRRDHVPADWLSLEV